MGGVGCIEFSDWVKLGFQSWNGGRIDLFCTWYKWIDESQNRQSGKCCFRVGLAWNRSAWGESGEFLRSESCINLCELTWWFVTVIRGFVGYLEQSNLTPLRATCSFHFLDWEEKSRMWLEVKVNTWKEKTCHYTVALQLEEQKCVP